MPSVEESPISAVIMVQWKAMEEDRSGGGKRDWRSEDYDKESRQKASECFLRLMRQLRRGSQRATWIFKEQDPGWVRSGRKCS